MNREKDKQIFIVRHNERRKAKSTDKDRERERERKRGEESKLFMTYFK